MCVCVCMCVVSGVWGRCMYIEVRHEICSERFGGKIPQIVHATKKLTKFYHITR